MDVDTAPALLRAPTREYRTFSMDNRRWDGFEPRRDDIVICTYPKCGTTWMQRIIDLLIFQSPDPRPANDTAPWLDSVMFRPLADDLATLAAQKHRRFVKTHLPLDSVPLWDEVKYIHVVRDGRDAAMSFHNHQLHTRPEFRQSVIEKAAQSPKLIEALLARGRARPVPGDPRAFFIDWLENSEAEVTEGYGIDLPFFEFENTYWSERRRPNLLFVHYNDLKADLTGEMARIAAFLAIETPDPLMPALVEAATFENMKRHADAIVPHAVDLWDEGGSRFVYKGTNGRWRDVLTEDDVSRYEALAKRKWTASQANWIAHGRLIAGDPRHLSD